MLNNLETNCTLHPQYVTLAYGGTQTTSQQYQIAQKAVDQAISSVLKGTIVDTSVSQVAGHQTQIYSQSAHTSKPESRLKLDMEEFLDLSGFQSPTTPPKKVVVADAFLNDVDELNTPVVDLKYPFNFNSEQRTSQNVYDINNQQPITNDTYNNNSCVNIKCESEHQQNVKGNVALNMQQSAPQSAFTFFNISNTEDVMNMGNLTTLDNKNPSVVSYNSDSTNNSVLFSPNNSENGDFSMYKTMMLDFNDEDDVVNMPTVKKFSDIFLNNTENHQANTVPSSTSTTIPYTINGYTDNSVTVPFFDAPSTQISPVSGAVMYDTPEESNCSSSTSARSTPKLKLDIQTANAMTKINDVIKTSDIINTLDELDSSKSFNIFEFITNEEIEAASNALVIEPNIPNLQISTEVAPIPSTSSCSTSKKTQAKRPYKRRNRDDDDEDYVPPTKKKGSSPAYIKIKVESSDDDTSCSEQQKPRSARGRPPKRHLSISSEDYPYSPESKYRELRDKNNEASRKSRLKRKMKEQNYEVEANHLEEKNIQLKAQVSELEKTVENLRTTLMTILLAKK